MTSSSPLSGIVHDIQHAFSHFAANGTSMLRKRRIVPPPPHSHREFGIDTNIPPDFFNATDEISSSAAEMVVAPDESGDDCNVPPQPSPPQHALSSSRSAPKLRGSSYVSVAMATKRWTYTMQQLLRALFYATWTVAGMAFLYKDIKAFIKKDVDDVVVVTPETMPQCRCPISSTIDQQPVWSIVRYLRGDIDDDT